ncbi:potassium channel family protein [Klugiella xanthotipulae]|uniref:Voltage-gated potassium channel n=1 Tax=Klugiella xanthotipulae TaxID=244735 RepID=A0A543HZ13_9MICO|nr:potassium channel family protein [Klugiella xanthotipulae]TQM63510.1 voltage-gated potassium channel [Klugiella xanthotipulae]
MTRSEKPDPRVVRRARWERATSSPLLVCGVLFIVAYSVLVLVPSLPGWLSPIILAVVIATWLIFLFDYVARWLLTPRGQRGRFVRATVPDLLSVLMPLFRAFRVLRDIPYLSHRTGAAVRTRVVAYAACYAAVFIYVISLATLRVERDAPGSTITTLGDALWWACVTVATVGYGDTYPVTGLGRLYAVMLMAGGIVIVGTASAVVISYLNEHILRVSRRDAEGSTPVE